MLFSLLATHTYASPVYVAKDSRLYHHDRNCTNLNTTVDLIEFASAQQANNNGAIPCNHCESSTVKKHQTSPRHSVTTHADKSELILGCWEGENSVIEYFNDGTFMFHYTTKEEYKKRTGKWNINRNNLILKFHVHLRNREFNILELSASTFKIETYNANKDTYNRKKITTKQYQKILSDIKSGNGEHKDDKKLVVESKPVNLVWEKEDHSRLMPLDKEASKFVNAIINKHWLISDGSWFTIVISNKKLVQMKEVGFGLETQVVKEVDKMNGIQWKGYFYVYPKFTRDKKSGLSYGHEEGNVCGLCGDEYSYSRLERTSEHTTFKVSEPGWSKWYTGNEVFGVSGWSGKKRIYRYEVWKTNDKLTLETFYMQGDCADGWCSVGKYRKPKREELP